MLLPSQHALFGNTTTMLCSSLRKASHRKAVGQESSTQSTGTAVNEHDSIGVSASGRILRAT